MLTITGVVTFLIGVYETARLVKYYKAKKSQQPHN